MSTKEYRISAIMLWDELRSALVNAEKVIEQIVETRAWEPLGYSSFADAWTARMQGLRLASDGMRVSVVYALYDSGLDDEQVREALGPVSGIGPETQSAIRRQYDNGVPAQRATVRTRSYVRELPSPPRTVHVILSAERYAEYERFANRIGSSLTREAAKAVEIHFARLAREAKTSA